MPDWGDTDSWFTSEHQLKGVSEIIMSRLTDDHFQEECRYLLRFWWHLHVCCGDVSYEKLQSYVSANKLQIIDELLAAIDQSADAVDQWIAKYRELPPVADRRNEVSK